LRIARDHFHDKVFTRKEYLQLFKTISPVTASHDLKWGVDAGTLTRTGETRKLCHAVEAFVDPHFNDGLAGDAEAAGFLVKFVHHP